MADSIVTQLRQLGLTKAEVSIYQALLRLGSCRASTLTKQTKLPRATIYLALDTLIERHLVIEDSTNPIKQFQPLDPTALLTQQREKLELAEALFPQLRALYLSVREQPQVNVYVGLDEIKRMYNQYLNLGIKRYKVLGSEEFWYSADAEWFEDFAKRRHAAGMHVQIIFEDSKRAHKSQAEIPLGREIKFIPNRLLSNQLTGEVAIFPDRVIFQNYGKEFVAIEVLSQEAANTLNILFDLAWSGIR